jgi:two-component system response regulator AtoC
MPLSLQVKLLRVLQEKSFRRVGDVTERAFHARIIAATNKDLEQLIKEGTFREDLFYRLNGLNLFVPPLRERKEEIEPLLQLFVQDAAQQIGRRVDGFSDSALEGLRNYAWPGNVRELKNVIERAVLISDGPILDAQSFSKTIVQPIQDISVEQSSVLEDSDIFDQGLWDHVETLERKIIKAALSTSGDNRSEAARLLKIPRKTLLMKIKKYDLGFTNPTVTPQ